MPEITETDRERALKLAEALDGAVGPATQLKILERELAKLREEMTGETTELVAQPSALEQLAQAVLDGRLNIRGRDLMSGNLSEVEVWVAEPAPEVAG